MPLLGLPNELIYNILDLHSGPTRCEDLMSLAQCSRRLNGIVTPTLLADVFHLEDPSTIALQLDKQPHTQLTDVLSVLNISFSVRSIDYLSCQLVGREFDTILYNCYRLYLFISRLDRLNELEIRFPDAYGAAPKPVDDKTLQRWTTTFGRLLNISAAKGCRRLQVKNGATLPTAYLFWSQFNFANVPTVMFDFLGRKVVNRKSPVLRQHLSGYIRWGPPGSRSHNILPARIPKSLTSPPRQFLPIPYAKRGIDPSRKVSLRSLDIASHLMVVPPFSGWLFDALQNSPHLSSLSLRNLHRSYEEWIFILALLSTALPSSTALSSFSFTQCSSVPVTKFDHFLKKLNPSHLTHLTIDHSMPYISPYSTEVRGHPPIFPHLKTLIAPSDYYAYLLKSPRNLTQITKAGIYPRTSYLSQFGFEASSVHLEPILQALFARSVVSTTSNHTGDVSRSNGTAGPWIFLNIVSNILELERDHVHAPTATAPGTAPTTTNPLPDATNPHPKDRPYTNVMELSLPSFTHYWNQASRLAHWIARFPNLRALVFRSPSPMIFAPSNWNGTGPSFIGLVKEVCPRVRILRNGSDVYRLRDVEV